MMSSPEVVATQGGEHSYHAVAARQLFGENVKVLDCEDFGQVVRASRSYDLLTRSRINLPDGCF